MESKTLIIVAALSLLAIIVVGVAFSGLANAQVNANNTTNPQGQGNNGYCQNSQNCINATCQNSGNQCGAQQTNGYRGGCGCGCSR
jgi:hypothetical protein